MTSVSVFGKLIHIVGNIPFDSKEEDIIAFFSRCGPVLGFRMVTDKETNKPKGFGFCEYFDKDCAMCAIRKLNKQEFNGRQLRVDYAENARIPDPDKDKAVESKEKFQTIFETFNQMTPDQYNFVLREFKE